MSNINNKFERLIWAAIKGISHITIIIIKKIVPYNEIHFLILGYFVLYISYICCSKHAHVHNILPWFYCLTNNLYKRFNSSLCNLPKLATCNKRDYNSMKERRGVLVPFVANNYHLYLSFVLIGINNVYIVYISALDESNATKRPQRIRFLDVQGKV